MITSVIIIHFCFFYSNFIIDPRFPAWIIDHLKSSDDPFFFWENHHCHICGKDLVVKRSIIDGSWFYKCKSARGRDLTDPHEKTWPFMDYTINCDCKKCKKSK